MQNTSFTESEKSLVLAGIQGKIKFSASAEQMQRLFGARGGAARQNVLVAAETDSSLKEGGDRAAWSAYCTAKKKGICEEGARKCKKGKSKGMGDGQALNRFNRRASVRIWKGVYTISTCWE